MELNFIDVTSILFTFGATILMIFLLTNKSQKPLSNILLASYLFFTILDSSSTFVSYFIYSNSPTLGMLISEMVFLIMPMFYLFVKSSVYKDFKLKWTSLWHLLPYFGILIFLIPGYFLTLAKDPGADWVELLYGTWLYKVTYLSIHIQIYIYTFFIFRLLFRYKKILLENFSNPKMDNYRWLFQLIVVLFVEEIFATVKNYIRFNADEQVYMITQNLVMVVALSIIFWLIIKALRNPHLFSGVNTDTLLVKQIVQEKEQLHQLENGGEDKIIVQLIEHMKQNEPYLDSSLSMHDLAKQLEVPTRELSVSINHTLNKHFFDFVNEYRIEKAKELIRNSRDEKQTILEILYEVGFNSKSSFNTAFKKHTGLTPTEFKKKASLRVA